MNRMNDAWLRLVAIPVALALLAVVFLAPPDPLEELVWGGVFFLVVAAANLLVGCLVSSPAKRWAAVAAVDGGLLALAAGLVYLLLVRSGFL